MALFQEANLSDADLSGANLQEANLSDADLSNANLSSADLSNANLSGANLSSADLSNANWNGADLSNTKFINLMEALAVAREIQSEEYRAVALKDPNSNKKNNPDQRQAFLSNLAEFLEKTIQDTGFSRSSLIIETVRNNGSTKKYALIHEGVPSQRYVLSKKQMLDLIEFLKNHRSWSGDRTS